MISTAAWRRGHDTKPCKPLPNHCHDRWSLECLCNVCQGKAAVPCRLISFCRSSSMASSSAISNGVSPSLFTTPTFAPWPIRYLQRHETFIKGNIRIELTTASFIFLEERKWEIMKKWNGASFYKTPFTETSRVQVVICILIKIQWSGPPLLLLVNSMDSCHWVHRLVNYEGVAVSCLKDHFSVDLGVINTSPSITSCSCVRFKNCSTRETRLHRPDLTTVWITLHIQSCSTSSFSLEIKHSYKTLLGCKYRIWVSFFFFY